jgi:acyl carrier protein
MNRDVFLDKVKNIVSEQLKINIEDIGEETQFVADLKMDSLNFVVLNMMIEDSFNIKRFPEDATLELKTVGQAVDQIEKALENQSLKIETPDVSTGD